MTLLWFASQVSRSPSLTCLSLFCFPTVPDISPCMERCDAAAPGFVIITFPGSPLHTFFTSLSFVGLVVPGCHLYYLDLLRCHPSHRYHALDP